jgi:hypothetical protein
VLVVLDTTALVADRYLQSNAARLLLSQSVQRNLRVGVPEVSYREAVNKVREQADEALDAIGRGSGTLRRLRAIDSDIFLAFTAEDVAATYDKFLRAEFERSAVEVLAIPDVAHAELVDRALYRQQPFDNQGRGYRDALIWETVRAVAKTSRDDIGFISHNHRDFAESGKSSGLARMLQDDIKADGAPSTVTLYDDLDAFLTEHVRPAVDVLKDLRRRVDEGSEFHDRLMEAIEAAIDGADPDISEMRADAFADHGEAEYSLEEARLHSVHPGVTVLQIANARRLTDEAFALDMYVEADADVDFYLYRIYAPPSWLRSPLEDDEDTAPQTVTGTTTKTLGLTVEATYWRSEDAIEDVRVISASTLS